MELIYILVGILSIVLVVMWIILPIYIYEIKKRLLKINVEIYETRKLLHNSIKKYFDRIENTKNDT